MDTETIAMEGEQDKKSSDMDEEEEIKEVVAEEEGTSNDITAHNNVTSSELSDQSKQIVLNKSGLNIDKNLKAASTFSINKSENHNSSHLSVQRPNIVLRESNMDIVVNAQQRTQQPSMNTNKKKQEELSDKDEINFISARARKKNPNYKPN